MASVHLVSSGLPNLVPDLDRSEGIHHSDVLSDLCVRLGHYDKSEMEMSRLQLGFAMEDAIAERYAQHFPNRYIRPGELSLGDLPITLDLLDTIPYTPEECKLSWLSSKHDPMSEKFARFRWQVMSQCCALKVRQGRLNITHINGDYKGFAVHNNVWEYEWDESELKSHEIMILRHRDRMLKEGWSSSKER